MLTAQEFANDYDLYSAAIFNIERVYPKLFEWQCDLSLAGTRDIWYVIPNDLLKEWCAANVRHHWCLDASERAYVTISFEDPNEAMLFKLTWI